MKSELDAAADRQVTLHGWLVALYALCGLAAGIRAGFTEDATIVLVTAACGLGIGLLFGFARLAKAQTDALLAKRINAALPSATPQPPVGADIALQLRR